MQWTDVFSQVLWFFLTMGWDPAGVIQLDGLLCTTYPLLWSLSTKSDEKINTSQLFSPCGITCVSDASGWQVSELSGTWSFKKEKIIQTVAGDAIVLQWWARVRWLWVLPSECTTGVQGNGLLLFCFNSFFFPISSWAILDSVSKTILIYLKYFWRVNLFL